MYDQGLACERNLKTAANWYRKAAEAGNPIGENNLADLLLRGEGVRQNSTEAFRWFQKAAAQGHTGARIKLAYMYAEGMGTSKDPESAYAWLTSASLAGDQRGRDMLPKLEAQLTPQQLAEARKQARNLSAPPAKLLSAKAFAQ
jgi:hypothetical protein